MSEVEPVQHTIIRIKESTRPTVLLGIGLPGSDRSLFLRQVGHALSAPVINIDVLSRQMEYERPGGFSLKALSQHVLEAVGIQLEKSDLAIVDEPNCYRQDREHNITNYRAVGAVTVGGVWLNTPLATAIQRDRSLRQSVGEETITYLHRKLMEYPPRLSEGFDWLETINNG